MLEMTELTPFADAMPGTLGRNWQKRAGLARALMLEPEVLLLDHPLGGLDLRHASWWLNFLDQLAAGQGQPGTSHDTWWSPWRICVLGGTWRVPFRNFEKAEFHRTGPSAQFQDHEEPLVKELLAEELLPG